MQRTIMLMALFLAGCMQAPQADLEGLKSMGDDWQAAYDSAEGATIAALYTENGAVLPPNGETVSGRDAIADFWSGFFDSGMQAKVTDNESYASGDLGYKVGSYTISDGEGSVVDEGKYVEVWRNVDGSWQLHRDIFNSDRPLSTDDKNRVVVTAQVEDADTWEKNFRTHGDLLKSMSQSMTWFTADDNWIAVYSEPADVDKYMEVLDSEATADAMKMDGVKRDTVKVFVLDKSLAY